jgi:hypothetical protein
MRDAVAQEEGEVMLTWLSKYWRETRLQVYRSNRKTGVLGILLCLVVVKEVDDWWLSAALIFCVIPLFAAQCAGKPDD